MRTFAILVACLLFVIPCQARTIFVDSNATGTNDGSSWANAYRFLQDALTDANSSGDVNEIRVAQGIYKPDCNSADPNGSGDREATFQLVNGVSLMGGYAGVGELDPNGRDIGLYESVLSGDLKGDDGGNWYDPSKNENSYHVVSSDSVDDSTIIDGFLITAGRAEHTSSYSGGGGMYNYQSKCKVMNCIFIRNYSNYLSGDSSGSGGAGMYNYGTDSLILIKNCDFIENKTSEYGGALHNFFASTKIVNCCFLENSGYVSQIMINGGPTGVTELNNCILDKGSGDVSKYGSIEIWNQWGVSNCKISNCTITNHNSAAIGLHYSGANITISNSIIWSNNSSIRMEDFTNVNVSYCNIQGGELGVIFDGGTLNYLEGNIDVDPCFADPCNDDYHLKSQAGRWNPTTQRWVYDEVTSLCIDAGDPNSSVGLELNPNGGRINMGVYGGTAEASKSYCTNPIDGDINGDCKVDFKDFSIMASHWLEDNR